jgi:hypothetical protein
LWFAAAAAAAEKDWLGLWSAFRERERKEAEIFIVGWCSG